MQKRAIATRQAVLVTAAEVFNRTGYVNAGLQEIISESGVTKGSLYFHFSSKEQLARAVIDEGCARLDAACSQQFDSRTPALEALIGISYVLIDPSNNDNLMLAAFRLLNEMGDFRGTGHVVFDQWTSTYQALAARAVEEGDFRADTNPDAAGRLLLEITFGTRLLAVATDTLRELPERMTTAWKVFLPGLVDDAKVDYFSQFAARRLSSYLVSS
ncbi:ScbR family autoregulator-binding transcription factor [Rhodococcus opacus]|uniref:ScbR family autoregulator-binding transcription factor n=1 Tax=Rhodococcus opacus TaxID=37919 RepID=A0AAX3YSR4_RHOOP|nr:ScbR family autoregulator-binding transcription factor [Rhodococcus opacus]MCZ4590480.1 ScbR family autoregulator-binding transcription factor [Rhodococcus opacus]WLF52121.1 ScbR family autoregulator-binding transcription factor [Rhodococcus opacus]